MVAFLNERSLEEHANWGAGLRLFWEAATELSGKAELFRDSSFFFGPEFKQRLGHALAGAPSELRPLLRQIAFSNRYWKCWRAERISGEDEVFCCENPRTLLRDESICEAAERKLRNGEMTIGVISIMGSTFSRKPRLYSVKQSTQNRVELRNADSVALVRQWIADERGYYDAASSSAPKDFQTILEKDSDRFQRTGRFQNVAGKDRRVYLEVCTGRRFYVDEGHPGHSAHLEVFDSDGRHFGVADIATGEVDITRKDNNKRMSL